MRPSPVAVIVALGVGCTGAPGDSDSDSDVSTSCDPRVPERFCFLWQTQDPCPTESPRSFRVVENGELNEDGSFSATERWFFFTPNDPSHPQVDTVQMSGEVSSSLTPTDFSCVNCDIVLEVELSNEDVETGWNYDGKREAYSLDWTNPDGDYQENMGFLGARAQLSSAGNLQDLDAAYIRGTYAPISDEPGTLPGAIEWQPFDNEGHCYERW